MIETAVARSVVVLPDRRDAGRLAGRRQRLLMVFVVEHRNPEAGRASNDDRHQEANEFGFFRGSVHFDQRKCPLADSIALVAAK